MPVLPVAEFAPDMPDLATATNVAQNVVPQTPESYGPVYSLAAYSDAMDGACLGMISVEDIDASVDLFAGTFDKLYQMTGSGNSWTDVSLTGGYSTAQGDVWKFAQFNRRIIATNYANNIQTFLMGTDSAFSNLSSDAPKARHLAVVKNFAMVGDTSDGVGGINRARLWWSASGDPTSWPTPGSSAAQAAQSDYQDLVGRQGSITGLVPNLNGLDVVIFFERGVWRGQYVGPPDIFDFFPVEGARGCRAPNSIVQMGGVVFYLAEDGFYVFDGSTSTPIGANKIDRWFYSSFNRAYPWSVIGAADPQNKLITWIFPSSQSLGNAPDTMLMYRWDIQRWSVVSQAADWIAGALSFGVTMEGLASLGFTDLDTLPASLDSAVWVGGALQLAAADSSHKLAFFTGSSLEASIGTQVVQAFPGKRAFVQSARPMVDGGTPTVALSSRTNFYDAETFGTAVAPNAAGECPQRSDGRYHRALVTVPAASTWTHCRGVDVTAIPAGVR